MFVVYYQVLRDLVTLKRYCPLRCLKAGTLNRRNVCTENMTIRAFYSTRPGMQQLIPRGATSDVFQTLRLERDSGLFLQYRYEEPHLRRFLTHLAKNAKTVEAEIETAKEAPSKKPRAAAKEKPAAKDKSKPEKQDTKQNGSGEGSGKTSKKQKEVAQKAEKTTQEKPAVKDKVNPVKGDTKQNGGGEAPSKTTKKQKEVAKKAEKTTQEVKPALSRTRGQNKKETQVEEETELVTKKVPKSKRHADQPSEIPVKKTKSPTEAKAKRGKNKEKAALPDSVTDQLEEHESEPVESGDTKRKVPSGNKEKGASTLMNPTSTVWEDIDFKCSKKSPTNQASNFHITSWNVDGLRAWLKKGGINILKYDQPEVFCLQETKCGVDKLPDELVTVEGYEGFWCQSDKDGYAGVGILTKVKPLSVQIGIGDEEQDSEGRCITVEFEKFYLINVYVPNAGRKLVTLPKRLQWNELFKTFVKERDLKKPVIICGDMNVAHNEIDLSNPKTNTKNAGFTKEEREGMTDFLGDGYVDTFRKLYPEKQNVYTFWTYMSNARARNVGWRLDYFIVSTRFMDNVCDNIIFDKVLGSDHCPLALHFNI